MTNYRWPIPAHLQEAVVIYPSSIPERVTEHLVANGITPQSVTIKWREANPNAAVEPALIVESTTDPTTALATLTLDPIMNPPDLDRLKEMLAAMSPNKPLTQPELQEMVVTTARLVVEMRDRYAPLPPA